MAIAVEVALECIIAPKAVFAYGSPYLEAVAFVAVCTVGIDQVFVEGDVIGHHEVLARVVLPSLAYHIGKVGKVLGVPYLVWIGVRAVAAGKRV